jgi:hypothetical protein
MLPLSGETYNEELQLYRSQIAAGLPQLRFLDSMAISSPAERGTVDEGSGGGGAGKGYEMVDPFTARSLSGADNAADDDGGDNTNISGGSGRGGHRTEDPMFALAEVKLHAGIITEEEYVKIMTVHRAVSVYMDQAFNDSDDSDDEAVADGSCRPRGGLNQPSGDGGGGGILLDESPDEPTSWLANLIRAGIELFTSSLGKDEQGSVVFRFFKAACTREECSPCVH